MKVRASRIAVVCKKEIRDGVRDRRSLFSALLYALLGPLVMVPLLIAVGKTLGSGDQGALIIPMAGVQEAPGVVEALHDLNIETREAPADARAAVRDQREDVVVIVPPGYADAIRAGRPAPVVIVSDRSRTSAADHVSRVVSALEGYSALVGAQRLLARGVRTTVTTPLALEMEDVSTPSERGALLLSSIPMFVVMAMFMGSAYVAVDVTAGERERGSLEPLLANPVSDAEVVLGKVAAVCAFGIGAVLVSVAGFAVSLSFAPMADLAGMRFSLTPGGALQMLVVAIPLVLPMSAVEIILGARAKGSREALVTVMFVGILPMIPGIILALTEVRRAFVLVPVVGQELLIRDALRGGPADLAGEAMVTAGTLALGAALTVIAILQQARTRTRHGVDHG